MSLHEKDPRHTGYIALLVASCWYQEITSETAIRIAEGKSHAKPGNKLTPDVLSKIKIIIKSPNFRNIDSVVRRYRVNKYEVFKALDKSNRMYANEEVVVVPQIEILLKRLKERAESCCGNCEGCNLNTEVHDGLTLCELLCSLDFDEAGNLVCAENKAVQKNAINCNKEMLDGETKSKGFEVYKNVLAVLDEYTEKHKSVKVRDIVSSAILEYVERHG